MHLSSTQFKYHSTTTTSPPLTPNHPSAPAATPTPPAPRTPDSSRTPASLPDPSIDDSISKRVDEIVRELQKGGVAVHAGVVAPIVRSTMAAFGSDGNGERMSRVR